jgi:hypothetical protein
VSTCSFGRNAKSQGHFLYARPDIEMTDSVEELRRPEQLGSSVDVLFLLRL